MSHIEVSVVIPCLNEEETIGTCVEKAQRVFKEKGIPGEVLVVDNGSTDRSADIVRSLGARVILQKERGYGAAYLKGFEEAAGKYIVMGDADDTYDFLETPKFIDKLKSGFDFVMGSRFKGKILPGAMPWLHRYIGNPVLSFILNKFFGLNISDTHCGMRAFTKDAYKKMLLRTTGMELASEMVINASKAKLKIAEIPIIYHPRKGESKLRSFYDGWRHLRFMLMYSPTHLFLMPGIFLTLIGLLSLLILLRGPLRLGNITFGIHYMVVASFLAILGIQIIFIGFFAKIYSLTEDFAQEDKVMTFFAKYFNLEKGIILGLLMFLTGFSLFLYIFIKWAMSGFGALEEIRTGMLALTLTTIGIQTIFSSFFASMLSIKKRR
jgi:glycosyltransferase involved in cell wall biosynthesis